ncbi:LysR substrate-binding domain-containing protein [Pseudorhizobium pelagicum]|uniref:LysR substrate-binding domain-containing protein n=1 Tax=Pseudorhizobium pelagicum TaxID=1509405 RepID=UPI0005635E4E|nr:LysR substrate-binding domain-containing protein [Pseudorhizobium pelagicum]
MQLRKRLPSLTALLTLEAVLRRRSFTAAAADLGVTQAAVSRQIAALEEELGQALFLRKHRGIEPTAACLLLGSCLAQNFTDIADTIDAVKSSARDVVTIGATVAFSSFWLLPRLAAFRRRNPGVQVRVVSQDTKIDLGSGEIDLVVRYGRSPFSDGTVIASTGDVIFPVCSPDYLEQRQQGPLSTADDFIEAEVSDRSWYSWRYWLAQNAGHLEIRPTLQFTHYTEAISAARAGQGAALGWGVLVQSFLDEGSLVRIGTLELAAEGRYNVMLPLKARRRFAVDEAAAWIADALQGGS